MNKFLIYCLSFASALLIGFASPAFAFSFGSSGLRNDCYPENSFVANGADEATTGLEPGPTFAFGQAEGTVEEIEEDKLGNDAIVLGGGTLELEFGAKITGLNTTNANGAMQGRLKATVHWNSSNSNLGGVKETKFEAGCAQEIQTDHQGWDANHPELADPKTGVGEFEGEYEGGVTDFPGFKGTTKPAVGSIAVMEDPDHAGKVEVDFVVELGMTCYEDNAFFPFGSLGDIEFEKISLKNLDPEEFHINNNGGIHGRWSFPPAFVPQCRVPSA
jgi:hypothetical protein